MCKMIVPILTGVCWFISVAAVATAAVHGDVKPVKDLKTYGVLKGPDGKVAAALEFVRGDRAVVAYVVRGTSEAEHGKKVNWSEVRLMDLATGNYRVLDRAETPVVLPGIGANHTLLGFTGDGKKVVATTVDPGGTPKELLLNVDTRER
jgi:hypothetical protein